MSDWQCEAFVYGTQPLTCSIGDFEDDVFGLIEGLGDVTGSGAAAGWKLDLVFDNPNCFVSMINAVRQVLTDLDHDLHSVTVSVRGRRHRLVDLL